MGAILKVRDDEGNIIEIPALKGDPGKGDMEASVYDTEGKKTDVFKYIDQKVDDIPEVDAYTKAQTLAGATKTMFGLGADAVPDDVFGILSRFQNGLGNEYVWAKGTYVEEFNVGSFVYDSINVQTTTWNAQTMVYSDTPDMQNAQSVSVSYDTYQNANVLAGKFFYKEGDPSIVYYGEPDTIAGRSSASNLYRVELSFSLTWAVVTKYNTVGYVNSPDSNAYPVDDGFIYKALGQLGNKVQIATGSYTGTGTYGASNPNSLTFDFEPKFVFISGERTPAALPYVWGHTRMVVIQLGQSSNFECPVTVSGSTMTWYNDDLENRQQNKSNVVYNYVAIG